MQQELPSASFEVRNKDYRRLKELNYSVWQEAIERANVLTINNDLSLELGSNIEASFVRFALSILEEK